MDGQNYLKVLCSVWNIWTARSLATIAASTGWQQATQKNRGGWLQTERRTMNGARSVSESSRPSCLTPPATFHAQWLTAHTWLWSVNHPVCNDLCSQIHVIRSSLKKLSPQIGCNLKFDQDFEACWSFCCVDRAQFNYKTQCLGSVMALAMFPNGVNTSWSSIWCHL